MWVKKLQKYLFSLVDLNNSFLNLLSITPLSSILCSGVYFQGTTIGMAPIMSMCTVEQSGGIVMVSITPPPSSPLDQHNLDVIYSEKVSVVCWKRVYRQLWQEIMLLNLMIFVRELPQHSCPHQHCAHTHTHTHV